MTISGKTLARRMSSKRNYMKNRVLARAFFGTNSELIRSGECARDGKNGAEDLPPRRPSRPIAIAPETRDGDGSA